MSKKDHSVGQLKAEAARAAKDYDKARHDHAIAVSQITTHEQRRASAKEKFEKASCELAEIREALGGDVIVKLDDSRILVVGTGGSITTTEPIDAHR